MLRRRLGRRMCLRNEIKASPVPTWSKSSHMARIKGTTSLTRPLPSRRKKQSFRKVLYLW